MNVLFIISAMFASVATLGALVIGLVGMIKGNEFNKQYGNKLMQARVMLQGLALAMLALAYFSAQS